jgi:hypothetical protein
VESLQVRIESVYRLKEYCEEPVMSIQKANAIGRVNCFYPIVSDLDAAGASILVPSGYAKSAKRFGMINIVSVFRYFDRYLPIIMSSS